MFNFSYGPVGDFLGPNFTEQMEALKREFAGNPEILKNLEVPLLAGGGTAAGGGTIPVPGYDESTRLGGEGKISVRNIDDEGNITGQTGLSRVVAKYGNISDFDSFSPELQAAIQSYQNPKPQNYMSDLLQQMGPPPEAITGIIPDPNAGSASGTRPNASDGQVASIFPNERPVMPDRNPDGSPMISVDPTEAGGPGIETLMPAEEEGYKKYIASDTNPFESMGISALGQDALRQMIFERNNPQVNQSRGYKSYIG